MLFIKILLLLWSQISLSQPMNDDKTISCDEYFTEEMIATGTNIAKYEIIYNSESLQKNPNKKPIFRFSVKQNYDDNKNCELKLYGSNEKGGDLVKIEDAKELLGLRLRENEVISTVQMDLSKNNKFKFYYVKFNIFKNVNQAIKLDCRDLNYGFQFRFLTDIESQYCVNPYLYLGRFNEDIDAAIGLYRDAIDNPNSYGIYLKMGFNSNQMNNLIDYNLLFREKINDENSEIPEYKKMCDIRGYTVYLKKDAKYINNTICCCHQKEELVFDTMKFNLTMTSNLVLYNGQNSPSIISWDEIDTGIQANKITKIQISPICTDECPDGFLGKAYPEDCGCDMPDIDINNDGVIDCDPIQCDSELKTFKKPKKGFLKFFKGTNVAVYVYKNHHLYDQNVTFRAISKHSKKCGVLIDVYNSIKLNMDSKITQNYSNEHTLLLNKNQKYYIVVEFGDHDYELVIDCQKNRQIDSSQVCDYEVTRPELLPEETDIHDNIRCTIIPEPKNNVDVDKLTKCINQIQGYICNGFCAKGSKSKTGVLCGKNGMWNTSADCATSKKENRFWLLLMAILIPIIAVIFIILIGTLVYFYLKKKKQNWSITTFDYEYDNKSFKNFEPEIIDTDIYIK